MTAEEQGKVSVKLTGAPPGLPVPVAALSRRSAAARLLGLFVRIPPGA